METYIARQPIFDHNMKVYGYELLYRKSEKNYYEGSNDDESTLALITDAILVFGFGDIIDGTRGFINFSNNLLLSDLMNILPKEHTVIEILDRIILTPDILRACSVLKKNGYVLAVDDFVLDDVKMYQKLIDLADIIKVEYLTMKSKKIEALKKNFPHITFLAEKVETREEYEKAKQMGFELFQGFFFSKPLMKNSKEIGTLNSGLLRILEEIQKPEVNLDLIEEVIQGDVGLSYKLLKMSNFIHYGAKYQVLSIRQAMLLLGVQEIYRWVCMMLLRGIARPENEELIKLSTIRGRMMMIWAKKKDNTKASEYFMSGIFSSLDIMLNKPMEEALQGLGLSQLVKDTLLSRSTVMKPVLDMILAYEQNNWDLWQKLGNELGCSISEFMEDYMDAIRWQQTLGMSVY